MDLHMNIFVNRTLNLKKIKAIGFDMDYTLVRYNAENFERLAYEHVLEKLHSVKKYPKQVLDLKFNYHQVIQGLVIDKRRGNLLKLSRYGQVKQASHGTSPMPFREQQETYLRKVIDVGDPTIQSLDTSFSLSNGVLYAQLIDLKDKGLALPSYEVLAEELKEMIDLVHAEGPLKEAVAKNISTYIVKDPEIPQVLEKLKRSGKKLLVITNSEYSYTKTLLDYAIQPYLKEHKHWSELFEVIITLSQKPRFFTERANFLSIDAKTGLMSNHFGTITPGIYQGGHAKKLQKDLKLEGDEILYLGDHIYGDVVSIKKSFNWRTGLVLEPLIEEREVIHQAKNLQHTIDLLMKQKEHFEWEFYRNEDEDVQNVFFKRSQSEAPTSEYLNACREDMDKINTQLSQLITQHSALFNPYWGELMRAGNEESFIAGQVEKYACIYMTKISDLLGYSPATYFRPRRRTLPHEFFDHGPLPLAPSVEN